DGGLVMERDRRLLGLRRDGGDRHRRRRGEGTHQARPGSGSAMGWFTSGVSSGSASPAGPGSEFPTTASGDASVTGGALTIGGAVGTGGVETASFGALI